ncbi:MAG: hypothetical protein V3W41_06190 [Planctomycetota bacterium]
MCNRNRRLFRAFFALMLLAVLGTTGVAQARGNPGKQGEPAYRRIRQPLDPNEVVGSWQVGAVQHTLTAKEYYDEHVRLAKMKGSVQRAVSKRQVWEHILLQSEADGYGIVVTDAEVDAKLAKDDPDIHEGLLLRWKNQKISEAEGSAYTKAKLKIRKLKDMVLNSTRVTTQDAFDQFKTERLLYQFEYLRFAAEDYNDLVDMDKVDDLALRTYWTDNRMIQAQYRRPASVSAEFVYLDPSAITVADAKKMAPNKEVTRGEALKYFWQNRAVLMRSFPPDKRHLLKLDENTPLDKIVSPFSILEETIKKKLLVAELLDRAYAEAKAAGGPHDLATIAAKYKLGYKKVAKMPRSKSVAELRRFGFNIFNTLNAAEEKAYSAKVLAEGPITYFFFLHAKAQSSLPKFDEIKTELRGKYQSMQTTSIARDRARKAMSDLNLAVKEELASLKKELEAQAAIDAENRANELGLTKPQDRRRETVHAQTKARRKLEEEKRKVLPKHFRAWVKEANLKLHKTPYFKFEAQRRDRTGMADVEESRLLFLRSSYYVRSLSTGDVTAILLEDPRTQSFFIGQLIDKKDPELSTMAPIDLMEARARLAQLEGSRFGRRWRYPDTERRLALKVRGYGR